MRGEDGSEGGTYRVVECERVVLEYLNLDPSVAIYSYSIRYCISSQPTRILYLYILRQ